MADVSMPPRRQHQRTEAWKNLPWKQFQVVVFRLQKRIYRAACGDDRREVHNLQRLLLSSRAARYLAVRRVTQENRGKRTAGVDGVARLGPAQRLRLAEHLRDLNRKADPVRRTYIPKANGEWRPLGIPTLRDRAMQALVKLALEPEWEARFEPNAYGFRPGRSAQDAIGALFSAIRYQAKYVLDADIEKCFDRIDHAYLLEKLGTFPVLRRLVRAWLKAGVMDHGRRLFPEAGTPQGGVISPLLANIALHGLEADLTRSMPRYRGGVAWRVTVVRYADDFVVLHRDLETLLALKEQAAGWLARVGLRLKPSKTRITHTLTPYEGNVGFDFLGFHVRQHRVGKNRSGRHREGGLLGYKTIITPSSQAQKRHQRRLSLIVKQYRGAPQEGLRKALQAQITGWVNYYRHVVSRKVFSRMTHQLEWLLERWAEHRHPSKRWAWRRRRYWRRKDGQWYFGRKRLLRMHTAFEITRHAKVQGQRSPYDGDWPYWGRRLRAYAGLSRIKSRLVKEQAGRCGACGLYFSVSDVLEVHHRDGNHQNNGIANLVLLHGSCHDVAHQYPWQGLLN